MRGTWQSEGADFGQLVMAAGAIGSAAVFVWLVLTFLWLVAALVGLVLATVIGLFWWFARHGADMATVSHPQALPAPERPALPGRPVRAVEGPQLHIHLHGSAAEQAEQLAALRQSGYRAWDQRDREGR